MKMFRSLTRRNVSKLAVGATDESFRAGAGALADLAAGAAGVVGVAAGGVVVVLGGGEAAGVFVASAASAKVAPKRRADAAIQSCSREHERVGGGEVHSLTLAATSIKAVCRGVIVICAPRARDEGH